MALKTVRVVDERQLNGIRREIHALSRIDHPGIVKILAQGLHDGIPWYAMELLQGTPLRDTAPVPSSTSPHCIQGWGATVDTDLGHTIVVDELPPTEDLITLVDDSLPVNRPPAANGKLEQVLTLVSRLCSPLAFLHGEGIIHRDLKPENVLIIDGDRPVLFDFGLMSRISTKGGRATLSVDALLHGTVAYMAPEQIRGEPVDARADLYALGCILYELVTGRLPYRSTSTSALLFQHLQQVPAPPSKRAEGVPPALDHLIMKLLAKRPEDRIGYAADVVTALTELGASPDPREQPRPRSYLYPSRFAGRKKSLTTLHQQLGPYGEGLALIGGESGVGKTRLAREFAREAAGRGFDILVAECELFDTAKREAHGGAFYPLRKSLQAVADRCLDHGEEASIRIVGERGPVLARFEPSLAALPGQADLPEPVHLNSEAEEERSIAYLTDLLAAYAEDKPVLLLIDDLQWADDLTLKWLVKLQASPRPRLVVVGTYRLDESAPHIQALLSHPQAVSTRLERMDRDTMSAIVGDMLALHPPPAPLVDFLALHSEGNPFFISEYLRMAVDEGILVRKATGRWQISGSKKMPFADFPLPGTLRSLILRRLHGLSAPALAAAEAAAVLGREVDPSLHHALEATEDSVWLTSLAELVDRRVMEDAKGKLRFVHDKIRAVAYERIEPSRCVLLHERAAKSLEQALGSDLRAHLAELGNHWQKAGNLSLAQDRFLEAARRAARQYAHQDSERFYRTYLSLSSEPSTSLVTARNELASRVLMPRGLNEDTMQELQQALRDARSLGDLEGQAQSLENLGSVTRMIGRLQDAVALFSQALALYRAQSNDRNLGRILCRIGFGYAGIGLLQPSRQAFEEAHRIANANEDIWIEARARLGLARIDHEYHNLTSAHDNATRALDAFRTLGDRRREVRALNQVAAVQADQGHSETALDTYAQALALNRQMGERIGEGLIYANKGLVLHQLGRTEESHHVLGHALQVFRELGHHRYQGQTLFCIGQHLHIEGRHLEAIGIAKSALTLLDVVGDQHGSAKVQVALSRISMELGHLDEAVQYGARALDIATQIGMPKQQAAALCCLGEVAFRKAEFSEARVLHMRQHQAAQHVGPAWVAIAELHLGQVARAAQDLDGATLHLTKALEGLPASSRRERALAHVELGWVALLKKEDPTTALRAARLTHEQSPYRSDAVSRAISELQVSCH